MPFAYFGAKHGLASKYPRPKFPLIVEPFAGAAGYSSYHARRTHGQYQAVLNDLDILVVETWRRLQTMTSADLDEIDRALAEDERTDDMILKGLSGGHDWRPTSRKITGRMKKDWPWVRSRIEATLPFIRDWEIIHGDYRDLPNVEATWFIDPPYQSIEHDKAAGAVYNVSNAGLDFAELAEWCQSRRGQVIVCEQSPASWLPFSPIGTQSNASATVERRTEVVWMSDQQQESLF
jgi:hypothetical protein